MINEEAGMVVAQLPEDSPGTTNATRTHPILPGEPAIKIRPESLPVLSNLREIWAHRELLYFLIWRDLKVRYKQTIFGVAWVILQPLLMALVFAVFIGRLARVPSDGVPYAVFAYAGLLPWLFFSNSVASGSQSLVANNYVITKIYFPRLILPIAVVGVRLVDFLIAFSVLVGLMLYYGIHVAWSILMLPVFIAQITLLALGISIWFSALNARYRDVGAVLPVVLQLWMFMSPIIYPVSLVPQGWRLWYALNPVSGIIEGFRAALLGLEFNWPSIVISAVITISALLYFVYDFCRRQDSLVDVI
ncbi:MAG: lipopolysaccharide transport system permease protein [Acidobacteriota bacterium]|nr:lipopolysaccharide transport system permease protein [Acidobacteriota bacterium]